MKKLNYLKGIADVIKLHKEIPGEMEMEMETEQIEETAPKNFISNCIPCPFGRTLSTLVEEC